MLRPPHDPLITWTPSILRASYGTRPLWRPKVMELSSTDQAMEEIIRVMSDGREIDRIVCSTQLDEGMPTVRYRDRYWPVVDGCIQLDRPANQESSSADWAVLIQNLLPPILPDRTDSCEKLLQECFRGSLPYGVIKAVASLVALRFEQQARVLIVDFLREHRNARRLFRLLQMQLLFRERTGRIQDSSGIALSSETEQPQKSILLSEVGVDWEWSASPDESEKPDVDDSSLRATASNLQESIGSYRARESGTPIPGFEDLTSGQETFISPIDVPLLNERALIERTSQLGMIALDLLRYFSNNPGDRAVHAEAVLGYPMTEIRRLLLGSLGHYLKKTDSGGWECHPWVEQLLSALNENHKMG